jgi:hypothetical protein
VSPGPGMPPTDAGGACSKAEGQVGRRKRLPHYS